MKITDPNAFAQLRTVRNSELEEMLAGFPEEERDDRSDMQILADEAGYLYSRYSEEGTSHRAELAEARKVLRETKNGTVMPLLLPFLTPEYSDIQIQEHKATVNEHRRLGNLIKRLEKAGYYSQWL